MLADRPATRTAGLGPTVIPGQIVIVSRTAAMRRPSG